MQPLVGIVMGSASDLPLMTEAAKVLEEFEIPFEINVYSAHRTPDKTLEYAANAAKRGLKVMIAGAGGAAHLPGVVAALTPLPVIGVPVKSSNSMDGWDSVLSIFQMPAEYLLPVEPLMAHRTQVYLPHRSLQPVTQLL